LSPQDNNSGKPSKAPVQPNQSPHQGARPEVGL
jgi:hypothetical protein